MSASEAITRSDGSAQPTRWSPGDASKNQLYKSAQCVGDPSGGFVQSGEKLGRIHEGNTEAAPKSFRKTLAKNFGGSDAFSANGAFSQVSLGHRPMGFDCRRNAEH
jgi:hypothetical protein